MAGTHLQHSRDDTWIGCDGGGGMESIVLALFGDRRGKAAASTRQAQSSQVSSSFRAASSAASMNESAKMSGSAQMSGSAATAQRFSLLSNGSLDTEMTIPMKKSKPVSGAYRSSEFKPVQEEEDAFLSYVWWGQEVFAAKMNAVASYLVFACGTQQTDEYSVVAKEKFIKREDIVVTSNDENDDEVPNSHYSDEVSHGADVMSHEHIDVESIAEVESVFPEVEAVVEDDEQVSEKDAQSYADSEFEGSHVEDPRPVVDSHVEENDNASSHGDAASACSEESYQRLE